LIPVYVKTAGKKEELMGQQYIVGYVFPVSPNAHTPCKKLKEKNGRSWVFVHFVAKRLVQAMELYALHARKSSVTITMPES